MKLNKKQEDAINCLKTDIDELSNKPRRLFSALANFAEAFLENKTPEQKEHLNSVISDIQEWQDDYYKNFKQVEVLESIGKTARKVKKELLKLNGVNSDYRCGVEDACKNMAKELTTEIIEDIY